MSERASVFKIMEGRDWALFSSIIISTALAVAFFYTQISIPLKDQGNDIQSMKTSLEVVNQLKNNEVYQNINIRTLCVKTGTACIDMFAKQTKAENP
jgi:uncharacterized protein YerC